MRRVAIYPVVGLLWLLALSASAQQVRVMQWNVEGHLGNLANNNSAAAKAIGRIVNYNQPDIITFCELADNGTIQTAAAMIDWVTNNLTYFGSQTGVTFWVDIPTKGDSFIRNGSISRYPISNPVTYTAGPRGMESFRVQLSGTNALQIFHVHFKCCGDGCGTRQGEAESAATNMIAWASTNSFPYIFTGDCNESEEPGDTPVCAVTSTYHPVTTLLQGGRLVDFEPTTLSGDWRTWSTGNPAPFTNIRFDYILAATNRLWHYSGYVFSSVDWAGHGLYTNASLQNLTNDSQTASDHYCVVVDFPFPTGSPNFNVMPTNSFTSSGDSGGPFSPSSQTYTLSNTNATDDLDWIVLKSAAWLDVSPISGLLAPNASTNITVSVNASANNLVSGSYADTLRFIDTANGDSISRAVSLVVRAPPALAVSPGTGFHASGMLGGAFNSSNQVYLLSNTGSSTFSWTASKNATWIDLSSNAGTLEPGSNTQVVVSLSEVAGSLPAGTYTDTVTFVNITNGLGSTNRTSILDIFDTAGFVDDMEDGTNGWTATGMWHLVGTGACSNWHSPTYSWYYGRDATCSYYNGAPHSGSLTTPRFLVPADAILTFWSWESEADCCDSRNVYISTNDWVTADLIATANDNNPAWHIVTNNLSAFAGTTAQVRFQFVAVQWLYENYRGWYIDDVRVGGPPVFAVTPTNTFASSGFLGGPFDPSNRVCTLSNVTASSLSWSVTNGASWLTISPTNGTVAGGATVAVTLSIGPEANVLPAGNYSDTITFNNVASVTSVRVNASLAIQVSPLQAWQIQYFGSIGNPLAAPDADPDGDGMNNLQEFLAGADPTNSVSVWRIQASPTNGASPLTVNFTENSSGAAITNRLWTFGDGGTGTGTNASHTYTSAGTFSVGLTIFNLSGTAMLVASNLITVSPVAIWTNASASGNWSTASSWDPVAIPDHNCGVIFGTAGVTANVDNVSRTVSNITFNRLGDFCVTASGGAGLIVSNGITVTTNFTYTISAPVVLGGSNTWSVTSNATLQVSGPVSGSNSITMVGGGTLILSGTNTYSGGTTLSNGVLKIVGAGLITNSASIDIASGATLDVSGRTGGNLTLASGQTLEGEGTVQGKLIAADGSVLSPGGAVGTLTFLNDLVVSNAAVLEYDLGADSDLIAVSSNLTLGGTLNITDAGGFNGGVYTLFTYGGTLAYHGVTIGTVPFGYAYTIDTNAVGQVNLSVVPAAAISVEAADLRDRLGNLMPINGVAALAVDTGTNGFVDLQPTFPLSVGATWGADDRVVGLWDLSDGADGVLEGTTIVPYTGGVAPGQRLQLYWFPSLTLASNTVGVTYYGKYTDTNSPPLDSSDVWESGLSVQLKFSTASQGGSNPEATGRATLFTATAPVARFTASPTSGAEPLAVVFTDTSTGTPPLNLSWNLGHSTTTNTTDGASFVHAYPAGTYSVTLTASNSLGVSTLVSNNLITVITALQAWQLQYFGCTNLAVCPQAAADADPDGDGLSNTNEFLSGTNPTNSASTFRITAVIRDGNDVRVIWSMGADKTNALQAATDSGLVTNAFTDVFVVTNTVGNTTNYLDAGAATNSPSRFYRVRLVQ